MTIDELRERACAWLSLRLRPGLDPGRLVDECLASARQSLKDEFIVRLSPEAWAQISLTYVTVFLDSERDVSIGEMFAAAVADSLRLNRLNMLAEQLANRDDAALGAANRVGNVDDGGDSHEGDGHGNDGGQGGGNRQGGSRGGGRLDGGRNRSSNSGPGHPGRPKLTLVKPSGDSTA